MSFKSLKQSSQSATIQKITEQLESVTKGQSYPKDERLWWPTQDKQGNGEAVIRFLPPPENESNPVVKFYTHSFKVGSKYIVENCPRTIGLPCPICEDIGPLWERSEADRSVARARKGKVAYVSNIYVIDDRGNPENNGKVFVYKYGAKIFEKIQMALEPKFPGEDPIFPFDLWKGADFLLKVKKVGEFNNYDDSAFSSRIKPLLDGKDETLEPIWKKCHSLSAFVDPSQFSSYEDIAKKYAPFAVSNVSPKVTATPATPVTTTTIANNTGGDSAPPFVANGSPLDAYRSLMDD